MNGGVFTHQGLATTMATVDDTAFIHIYSPIDADVRMIGKGVNVRGRFEGRTPKSLVVEGIKKIIFCDNVDS